MTKITTRKVLEVQVYNVFALVLLWFVVWGLRFSLLIIVGIEFIKRWWVMKVMLYNVLIFQPLITMIVIIAYAIGFLRIYDEKDVPCIRIVKRKVYVESLED